MNLVQLAHLHEGRRVALVDGERLELLDQHGSVYALAQSALSANSSIPRIVERDLAGRMLSYDEVYSHASDWHILPAFDHPGEPARCLVSGTGLTHQASASHRAAMHEREEDLTDSMRMYRWGVEGGRPPAGCAGTAPEWFYKGNGYILRGHQQPLTVPEFAEDGGEEAEVAGAYIIDAEGTPRRIGLAQGNEFSDHRFEKRNYLYLAPSKLRSCSLGPELVVDADFTNVAGTVRVERGSNVLWSEKIATGEANMCHSLENIEHHHFKFPEHRRPGDAHIHFFGAGTFSFGAGLELQNDDIMQVSFQGFGRPLRNPLHRQGGEPGFFAALPL